MTRPLPILKAPLRLARDRRGATAVEFALVVPLFLAMVFSIFEAGWLMTQTIMQDGALNRIVRQLRIADNAAISADDLKQRICAQAMVFTDCAANTTVELIALSNASDTIPETVARCVHRGTVPAYRPGERSELMFVRVCTSVRPMTPMLGLAVALPDGDTGAKGPASDCGTTSQTALPCHSADAPSPRARASASPASSATGCSRPVWA